MNDRMEDNIDAEVSLQRNCSKQLQTHNMPTDNVENNNSKSKGGYLPTR